MKKIQKGLSLFLAVVMCLSVLSVCAFAKTGTTNDPIVWVAGNGNPVYDKDGNSVNAKKQFDTSKLPDMIKEIIFPYFTNAITIQSEEAWNAYYDKFEEEIAKIYDGWRLDANGEPVEGDYVKTYQPTWDNVSGNTYSRIYDGFTYDSRLDPFFNAARLKEYIDNVKKVTKHDKVQIRTHCYGGEIVFAYFEEYGYDSVSALMLDTCVQSDAHMITGLATGKIKLDGKTLQKFASEITDPDLYFSVPEEYQTLYEFAYQTINVLNRYGVVNLATDALVPFTKQIGSELLPRLFMTCYGTCPGYWATVENSEWEDAMKNTFSCKDYREKYAGLIEKIENYHEKVGSRIPEIMQQAKDSGINFGVIAKYGTHTAPCFETSYNQLGDDTTLTKYSSFGATCSTIDSVLPAEYRAEQNAKGLSRYISPDYQIDASTCFVPDQTWFVKGIIHDNYSSTDYILRKFSETNGKFTVNDDPNWPQFMVVDQETKSDDVPKVIPMTKDNCNLGMHYSDGADTNQKGFLATFFDTLFGWVRSLINMVKELFSKITIKK